MNDCTSANDYKTEQQSDVTLTDAFKDAVNEVNGYFLCNDVLYHKDRIADQIVSQLVVPLNRRTKVMEIAHNSVWSGHLRERKTRQRIKMSFYWPGCSSKLSAGVLSAQSAS